VLAPHLEQTPPDQEEIKTWLQSVTHGNNLVINLPRQDVEDKNDTIPGQFGRVIFVAIVDSTGKVMAATPLDGSTLPDTALKNNLSADAAEHFQAALQGETESALLSSRDADRNIIAAVPILGANEQVLGVIFTKLAYPIEQSEFLQSILRSLIIPVTIGLVISGAIAGVLFGFLIARGLTHRLRVLAEAADHWSKGNFAALARDTSGDELGQLARRLNQMAEQLQNLLETRQELATLEERNRLARELHDSVKQQVFATAMQVGAARALLDQNPEASKENLAEAEQLVRQAQQELTSLIRELRPAALEGKGLATALRDCVTDWSRQSHIPAEVRVRGERHLPLPLEQALFRVVQEALTNIARHSGAKSVEVDLVWKWNEVSLTVSDNGRGFNTAAANGKGLGLQSMRERVEALGGHLEVKSKPGSGTQVIARLTHVG
jgi:NarL family two-component system sensor histidine kinase LiaS